MIRIEHEKYRIVQVSVNELVLDGFREQYVSSVIEILSRKHPDKILVWYDTQVKNEVNFKAIPELLNDKRKLISFNPDGNYFPDSIGYVEDSPFIKINKEVSYPTWQMSSCVGAVWTSTILMMDAEMGKNSNFDSMLNTISKHYQSLGLFCYSEPKLLQDVPEYTGLKASNYEMFRFVKQQYKWVWIHLLVFNCLVYESKVLLIPYMRTCIFYRKKKYTGILNFKNQVSIPVSPEEETIDVIIPTIGRKAYLYDVLSDFQKQTYRPKNVIIVEQNPNPESVSELDYLYNESWAFTIEHIFTHQMGACNARNLALEKVRENWVFFADDDIRLRDTFLKELFDQIRMYNLSAVTINCVKPNQGVRVKEPFQCTFFSSGSSLVKADKTKKCIYGKQFEFGFGEDNDFGRQLRNLGVDILFLSHPAIIHLKAPTGGFRTNVKRFWEEESMQPKPSPTIMLYHLLHSTVQQQRGYKTTLFFKFFKHQTTKNPIKYYLEMNKRWKSSLKWARFLMTENDTVS